MYQWINTASSHNVYFAKKLYVENLPEALVCIESYFPYNAHYLPKTYLGFEPHPSSPKGIRFF